MIIRYTWHSEPGIVKTFDTVEAFKHRTLFDKQTQKEFDREVLESFHWDIDRGRCLNFYADKTV